jgi:hypothetical protein
MKTIPLFLLLLLSGCEDERLTKLQIESSALKAENVELRASLSSAREAFESCVQQRAKLEKSYQDELHVVTRQLKSADQDLVESNQISANWRSNFFRLQQSSAENKRAQWVQALGAYQKSQSEAQVNAASKRATELRAQEQHRANLIQQRVEMATEIHRAESDRIRALRW